METENFCRLAGKITRIIDKDTFIIIYLQTKSGQTGSSRIETIPIWIFGMKFCYNVRKNAIIGTDATIDARIQNKKNENNLVEIAIVANKIFF